MYYLRLLLSLFVVAAIAFSDAYPTRSCQNEGNMAMVPDQSDRSAYYLCLYGRAEKFYCPPGYKFELKKPACVPKRTRT